MTRSITLSLSDEEIEVLRQLAEALGYVADRGPQSGEGSISGLMRGIAQMEIRLAPVEDPTAERNAARIIADSMRDLVDRIEAIQRQMTYVGEKLGQEVTYAGERLGQEVTYAGERLGQEVTYVGEKLINAPSTIEKRINERKRKPETSQQTAQAAPEPEAAMG